MYNAYLHVLHVVRDHPLVSVNLGEEGIEDAVRTSPESALENLVRRMLPHQTKVIEAVRYGQVYKEIVTYARSEDIDLIVIATHGRTGLDHIVMGSVAEKVVRMSPVPVLTIKPPRISRSDDVDGAIRRRIVGEKMKMYST